MERREYSPVSRVSSSHLYVYSPFVAIPPPGHLWRGMSTCLFSILAGWMLRRLLCGQDWMSRSLTAMSYVVSIGCILMCILDPGIVSRPRGSDSRESEDSTVSINSITGDDRPVPAHSVYCNQCRDYSPVPSAHCPVCRCCVQGRYHHCAVFGQCVGRQNIPVFIITALTALILVVICALSGGYLYCTQ